MYRFIVVKRNNEPQAFAGKQKLLEAAGRYKQAGAVRATPACRRAFLIILQQW
jgi:hypothetical protein